MTVVKKISKTGFDVLNTGDANLSFSSELASHNLYDAVTLTKTSPATSVTYNHGLGYVPKVWAFIELSDGSGTFYRRIPQNRFAERIDYYITTDDLVIETDDTATMVFRAVIFTRSPNP